MNEQQAITKGQIVISKKGRDKGGWFVVLDVATDANHSFAWLADGRLRPVERPKKKKLMHIQPTKYIDETLQDKLENDKQLNNSECREAICRFRES